MGYDILVVRLGDRFFCVDAACTYKWAMLTDGLVDREKLLITCKDCNGSWDLQTGQPKELPAKFPLTAYRIESVADDLIVTFTYLASRSRGGGIKALCARGSSPIPSSNALDAP